MQTVARSMVAVAGAVLVACGGRVDGGPDAAAFVPDGGGSEAGAMPCVSASGIRACGGPKQCGTCPPVDGLPEELGCLKSVESEVGICGAWSQELPDALRGSRRCIPGGREGTLCAREFLPTYLEDPRIFEIGHEVADLLVANGSGYRVRNDDLSVYTGEPPSALSTCPDLPVFKGCGGACGDCGNASCTGRGPKHPVGLCITTALTPCPCADPSTSCFSYRVEPSVQADADNYGICLASADCLALATALPGGGRCNGK